jgi:hypothetical protein
MTPVPSDPDAPPGLPPFRTMMLRGFLARCPICGSGHLFRGLRMRERCPRCGHRFERKAEDGFFLGAYLINLSMGLVLLAAVLMAYGLSLDGTLQGTGLQYGIAAFAVTFVVPLAFYPVSKTVWAAIELTLHPPDPEELSAALTWIADESARPGPTR